MSQKLTLAFGTGFLVGGSLIGLMNHRNTIYNFKKMYGQLTINNITSFCGTLWVVTLGYKFCSNTLDNFRQ